MMKQYVIYKKNEFGKELYLTPTGGFTKHKDRAKTYDVSFWVDLLKLIIEIIKLFGINSKMKFKEK